MLLLAMLACGSPETAAPTPPPDLLLVVLDTVRADSLALYGHHRATSPQMEILAERGVVFDDVSAPSSWTWPSHGSLFTGEPPWVHGARFSQGPTSDHQLWDLGLASLRKDLPTLAGRLGDAGYTTVSLAANPMLDPALGLTRGFGQAVRHESDLEVVAQALQAMQQSEGPLFLFINLMVAHHSARVVAAPWSHAHAEALRTSQVEDGLKPYLLSDPPGVNLYGRPDGLPTSGFDRLRAGDLTLDDSSVGLLRDLYDGEVGIADDMLTPLIRGWDQWRQNGVIAVTSDHGEYFGEHGLWEHGRTLRGPALGVPLVLAGPGLPEGKRIPAPVELLDLAATLLVLGGVETDEETLLSVINGSEPGPVRAVAWPDQARAERLGGVYQEAWRLYREQDMAVLWSASQQMLFDLEADPGMERDLAEQRPGELATLLARGQAAIPVDGAQTAPVPMDEDASEALRALGYVE